jgi:ABC-type multidrug transport system permease subunit
LATHFTFRVVAMSTASVLPLKRPGSKLSGTFFSSERFPQVLQPFIQALPLTALNNVLRALMNEGASLSSNWLPIAILLFWCVISFVVALKIFRWQ